MKISPSTQSKAPHFIHVGNCYKLEETKYKNVQPNL